MAKKEPENEKQRLMVERINEKLRSKKSLTTEEYQFIFNNTELFLGSKEFKMIDKTITGIGAIFKKT